MFTFVLLLVLTIALYATIRFFLKNKEARKDLFDQVKTDSRKLGRSAKKLVDEVENKIKEKI